MHEGDVHLAGHMKVAWFKDPVGWSCPCTPSQRAGPPAADTGTKRS
jgi:hypothetical protein